MTVPDLGGKLFSYKIKYTGRDGIENPGTAQFAGKNVLPRYNGNIAEVDWRSVETPGVNPSLTPKRYGYAYDKLNRLTAGYYQNPDNAYSGENTESLEYDPNGNITRLYRTSVIENTNSLTPTTIDNLSYTYQENRATAINDNAHNPSGYEGGGRTITYDLNGNMKSMPDKYISNIDYNFLNLPSKIHRGITLEYKYSANGIKLQKINPRIECGIMDCYTVSDVTDYLDGFQYFTSTTNRNNGGSSELLSLSSESSRAMEIQAFSPEAKKLPVPSPSIGLQFFPTAEGFYDYQKKQYIYQYKDHLGNVRISFTRNSQSQAIEITDANDYYPFGMNLLKTGSAMFGQSSYRNYKYQSQELQETGFYSFKWRNYMPDVGRFFNVDPLAESFPYNGVYNFSENRVVDGIELEGLEWVPWVVRVAPLMENAVVRPNPVVETVVKTSETTSKTTQEHHLIPKQYKNHEVVKQAREEDFKFEGKENKLSVEKFNKATGEGRHANHPKLNEQIKNLLDEIPKSEALNGLRNLRDKTKDAINNNPDTKLNDLKLKTAPPVEKDNINVNNNNPPPVIMPVPKPKDPCAGISGCV